MTTTSEALQSVMHKLSQRDRDFAMSLLSARCPTANQIAWMGKLVERVERPAPQRQTVGDVKGIVSLIETARAHLKSPKLLVKAGDLTVRISVAGAASRIPGSLNVTSAEGNYEGRTWYGRVTVDGTFSPSSRVDASATTAVAAALRALAADPANVAAEFGRLTGVCCFCARKLTDARSTAVGYGATCAKHFGLPWGA